MVSQQVLLVFQEEKKKKISPYVIESMVRYLVPYFKLYKIRRINLILKSRSPAFYPFLFRNLNLKGLTITG